jgi:hypothetical protein
MMDLSRDDIVWLIQQFVFSKRDRAVIYERLIDGLTFEQLSAKHDLSVRQIKNIVRKNKDIVFSHVDRLP